jgi:cobaltochelatase CobS
MNKRTKIVTPIATAFGIEAPQSLTIEAYNEPSPFTPKRDDNYQFRTEVLSDILAWWTLSNELNDGLFLTGPTGSGKSSVVCQIAARLNWPVQRLTAHSRLEMPEMIGHHVVIDGDLVWQDGPLTIAMREGHIFLLDEFDLLDPGTAAGLNGIVEGAPLVIAENGGELIEPHPDFRFIATGNTNGGGDRTGLFQGTLQQNAALMDRMWVVEVGYPTVEMEKAILTKACPNVPTQIADTMITVANEIRGMFMGEDGNPGAIEVTMSTRTLLRWAHMSWFFQAKSRTGVNPLDYALDRALANRANPETKRALHEIVQRHFG